MEPSLSRTPLGLTKGKFGFLSGKREIELSRLGGFGGKDLALASWEGAENWLGKRPVDQMPMNGCRAHQW